MPYFFYIGKPPELSWSPLGNGLFIPDAENIAITSLSSTRIAISYNVGFTTDFKIEAYDFDGTNWSKVGNTLLLSNINQRAIASLTSTLLAVTIRDNGIDTLRAYDFDGTNFFAVGNDFLISSRRTGLTGLDANNVGVTTSNRLQKVNFDGVNWSLIGVSSLIANDDSSISASSPTRVFVSEDGTLINQARLTTREFNGTSWPSVGTATLIGNNLQDTTLAALTLSDTAYIDATNSELKTYRFDNPLFSQIGNGLFISGIIKPAMAALTNSRIAFIDSGNKILRSYDFG